MSILAFYIIGLASGGAIGLIIGDMLASNYWATKAKSDTPVCHKGKFYYVVPEPEFKSIANDQYYSRES